MLVKITPNENGNPPGKLADADVRHLVDIITREGASRRAATSVVSLGIELRFPDKPPVEIRDRLKLAGWRWSRFSACWYHRDEPAARAFAQELSGAAIVAASS